MHCALIFGSAPLNNKHDSQTVAFFVSVVLVNLLLQCVFAFLTCTGSADLAFDTETGNPITWKALC
jgi:hypothetical protein